MTQKMTWYVRLFYFFNRIPTKIFALILILLMFFMCVLGYASFKFAPPMEPYEETYNIEFYNYVEDYLQNIADMVIVEGKEINVTKMPETVSTYNIKKDKQAIKISYLLDNEKIVSEYFAKTGKLPNDDDCKKEMKMDIQLSNQYQKTSMTSSFDNIPTPEEYKNSEYINRLVFAILNIVRIFILIIAIISVIYIALAIATFYWQKTKISK